MPDTDPEAQATTPIETSAPSGGTTDSEESGEATETSGKAARQSRAERKQARAERKAAATGAADDEAEAPESPGRFSLSALSGKRLVLVIAGVAVVSLLAGIAVMQFIVSPAELAARTAAPKPGLITVPVEERRIENTVTSRADVTYADAVPVKIETGGLSGPPVVTGQVPKAGTEFQAGSVALEVAGRPVIVLAGELPVYRTLSIGLSGPDVAQLKQALIGMGIDAGNPDTNVYDAGTAAGVAALYERVGYAPPAAGEDAAEGVRAAEKAVTDAQSSIQSAEAALAKAQQGPNQSEVVAADNAVRDAERALQREQQTGKDPFTIAQLQDALNLAVTTRNELGSGVDVSGEQAGVQAAYAGLESAQADLARAQEGAMATLPSSEVLFLTALPRRVDDITVNRGSVLEGVAMTVSGAKLVLSGTVSASDAELLKEGQEASFDGPKGEPIAAKVVKIAKADTAGSGDGKGDGDGASDGNGSGSGSGSGSGEGKGRLQVTLEPLEVTPEQLEALRGSNVRVTIPVAATDGDVLAVPLAALSAGSGGESRVEVVTEAGSGPASDAKTELVTVETGLAAGGFVEISSKDPLLKAGATVVVGR